jgi:hypothetical protein
VQWQQWQQAEKAVGWAEKEKRGAGLSWAERLSGSGALGRPILEKKQKEKNRNRLGCQGLFGPKSDRAA